MAHCTHKEAGALIRENQILAAGSFPALCLLVMKLTFRRITLISPDSLATHCLRSWVLEQLQREGEPLRWAITSIDCSLETSWTSLEVEAVLINP